MADDIQNAQGQNGQGKLVRIAVEGLVGRFNYDIEFDPDSRLLIIHGPNGVGKTRLLELVHSVFRRRYQRLTRIPFDRAVFQFEDERRIEIIRVPKSDEALPLGASFDRASTRVPPPQLLWKLLLPGEAPISHHVTSSIRQEDRRYLSRLEHELLVEQVDYDLWLDLQIGDEIGAREALDRYGGVLNYDPSEDDFPSAIIDTVTNHGVHLIETQRLLNPSQRRRRRGRELQPQQPTVVSYAENLSQRLREALAINSRRSQELDRSFPGRLFLGELKPEPEPRLRERYAEQLQLRNRLANVSLLDSSPDFDLPPRPLDDGELRVLATYLNDADAKLQTFQSLLDRLELLGQIVNDRFLFKRLEFNRDHGFVFSDLDSEVLLDPQNLSSGEQHELVLFYDLLLNASENTLVLIDEPEISLHVAWQKSFLGDLDRVASLTSLRFIIATHSPQIIGSRWDSTVELYSLS